MDKVLSDDEDGLNEQERAQLAFGKGYPFPRPDHSFTFCTETHEVEPLGAEWQVGDEREELLPVLACGSNAAPVQLRRKYPKGEYTGRIPVVAGVLKDYDSVFCPMFASYGSITATLAPSPGAELRVHVTFLSRPQLERMHKTEGGYHYGTLDGIDLTLDNGSHFTSIHAYIHKNGLLMCGGAPVSITMLPCKNRSFPSMSQAEILEKYARVLNQPPGDNFILTVINSKKRHNWNKKLATNFSQVFVGGYTVIDYEEAAEQAAEQESTDFTGLGM